jgi:hypothetical protein
MPTVNELPEIKLHGKEAADRDLTAGIKHLDTFDRGCCRHHPEPTNGTEIAAEQRNLRIGFADQPAAASAERSQ